MDDFYMYLYGDCQDVTGKREGERQVRDDVKDWTLNNWHRVVPSTKNTVTRCRFTARSVRSMKQEAALKMNSAFDLLSFNCL